MSLPKKETAAYELVFRFPLFDFADESGVINACIIGADPFSEEYFKAAVWSTQREGYRLNLDIFASPADCKRLEAQYPEVFRTDLLCDRDEIFCNCSAYSGEPAGGKYSLVFSSGVIRGESLEAAVKASKKAIILTESGIAETVGNIAYIPKTALDGERFLEESGIEKTALALFLSFEGNTEEHFYGNAFYYRSSVASALFWSLRRLQGQSISVCESNMRLEHRRWNAFTRTEGYRFGSVRSDTQKTHPCLVSWDMLDRKTQEYDANPIRAAGGV